MSSNLDLSGQGPHRNLPQRSNFIPVTPITPGIQTPPALSPIQEAFRNLKSEPQFQSRAMNATLEKGSTSVSGLIRRVSTLFESINSRHTITQDDEKQITTLAREVESLHNSLQTSNALTQDEKVYGEKCLAIAEKALDELVAVRTELKGPSKIDAPIESATNVIADKTYHPRHAGETLSVAREICQGVDGLKKMQQKIKSLPKDSAARIGLETTRDRLAEEFVFYLTDWSEIAYDSMEAEIGLLWKEIGKLPDNEKTDGLRQLRALRNKQEELCKTLEACSATTKYLPSLHQKLKEAAGSIRGLQADVDQKLSSHPTPLPPLRYGSKEWRQLVKQRPQKIRSPFTEALHLLTHPERWNNGTKAAVHTIFVGMQISQAAINFAQNLGLTGEAKVLHQEMESMQDAVPPEQKAVIEQDAIKLGNLLADQYAALQENPHLIEHLSEGNSRLQMGLENALRQFGETAPTTHELGQFLDTFQLEGYAAESASPFSQLTFSQWWSLFRQPEEAAGPTESETSGEASIPIYEYTPVTSSGSKPVPWVRRVFDVISSFFTSAPDEKSVPSAVPAEMSDQSPAPDERSDHSPEYAQMEELKRFIESSPIPIDDKRLLHVIGDFFGQETALEGSISSSAHSYFHAILSQKIGTAIKEKKEDPPSDIMSRLYNALGITTDASTDGQFFLDEKTVTRLLTQIERAMKIEKAMDQGYEQLHNELKASLTSLQPGESFFFSGGWRGIPAGHAMYYEFTLQKDGRYTMRTYNTGGGINYHPRTTIGHKDKYVTFVEINNIPLENILKRPIIKGFTELQTIGKWSADDIYLNLLPAIGGEINTMAGANTPIFNAQRSGTCTYMSLVTAISHQLPNLASHQRFHFESQFKTLHDYFQQHQSQLDTNLRSRNLLKKSVEEMARVAKMRFDDGIINHFELSYAIEKIREIHAGVQQAEERYLATIKAQSPSLSFSSDDRSGSAASIKLPVPEDLNAPKQPMPLTYHPRQMHTWTPKIETLASDLKTHLNTFEKAWKDKDYAFVIRSFEQLTGQLPIEWIADENKTLWESVPESQKIEAIHTLSTLSTLSYDSLLRNCQSRPYFTKLVESRVMAAHLKAVTFAHHLFTSSTAAATCPAEIFVPAHFDSENYFRLYDPKLDEEIGIIKGYWNKYWDKPEFKESLTNVFKIYQKPSIFNDSPDILKTPLGRWAKTLILQTEVGEKLKSDYPELKNRPIEEQVIFALADSMSKGDTLYQNKRDILPQYYNDLSDMLISLKALEQLPVVPNLALCNDIFQVEKKVFIKKDETIFTAEFKNYSPLSSEWYSTGEFRRKDNNHIVIVHSPHIKEAHRGIRNEGLRYIYEEGFKNIFGNAHEDTLIHWGFPKGHPLMEFQLRRALYRLFTENELKIKETVSYFIANPYLLESPNYQTLFELLIFEPGLLLKELHIPKPDADFFANTLAAFLSNRYQFYKDLNRIDIAVFFLHINELIQRYVHHASSGRSPPMESEEIDFSRHVNELCQRYAHDPSYGPSVAMAASKVEAFLDTAQETRALLQHEDLTPLQRTLLHQQLLLTFQGKHHLSKQEIKEVFISAAYTRAYPLSAPHAERQKELAVDRILHELGDKIKDALTGEDQDDILNAAVQTCFGEPVAQQWKPDPNYPLFTSTNGEFTINCLTVRLEKNENLYIPLSQQIAQDPSFMKLFPQDLPRKFLRNALGVYFFNYKGAEYRVRMVDKTLTVQREFTQNGVKRWYENVPKETLKVQVPVGALYYGPLTAWYTAEDPPHLIFANMQTNQLHYRLDTTIPPTLIHLLESDGKETNRILLDVFNKDSPWHFLTNFEDPNYILVWKNALTNLPEKIEFPRFGNTGLTFKIEKSKENLIATSQDFNGYSLAQKQYVPALKDFPYFLLLENKSGQQKVLLPRHRIARDKPQKDSTETIGSLDSTKIHLERNLEAPIPFQEKVLEYDIDSKTGALKPVTDEGRIYLALLKLWKMDYVEADSILRGFESFLRQYTPEEIEIVKWIISSKIGDEEKEDGSRDHDPRALSALLYASYLLVKNAYDYQLPPTELPNLPSQYETYLNQLNNIHAVRLKPAEEQILMCAIGGECTKFDRKQRTIQTDPQTTLEAPTSTQISLSSNWRAEIEHAKQLKPMNSASEFIAHYRFQSGNVKTSRILKPAIIPHFKEAYAMLKDELDAEKTKMIYHQLTGLELTAIEKEAWKEELVQVFEMMRISSEDKLEQPAIRILIAVLHSPERFPPSDTIIEALDPGLKLSIEKKLLEEKRKTSLIQQVLDTVLEIEKANPSVGKTSSTLENDIITLNMPSSLKPATFVESGSVELMLPYQMSLATPTPDASLFPQVSPDNVGFTRIPPPDVLELPSPQHSLDSLQKSFQLKIENPDEVVIKEFDRIHTSIADYASICSIGGGEYEINDLQKLKLSAHEIRQQANDADMRLQKLGLNLLALANKAPETLVGQHREQAAAIGESKTPLTLNSLIQLFWRRDAALMHQKNPNLTPDDCTEIQEKMADYLFLATHQQYLSRTAAQMGEIIASFEAGAHAEETGELIKQFYIDAAAVRTYDVNMHPEYLVLEYYLNIRIRKNQADNLDVLMIHEGKVGNPQKLGMVIEMIMGAGKTAVLLPLLALLTADGDNLSMVMMPEALMPSMSQDLARLQGPGFEQSVQAMTFDRETKIDKESLAWILNRLNTIREEKQVLLITSSSIQSLYLKYVELLYLFSEATDAKQIKVLEDQLGLMRKIFGLFKEKGSLIIDEADIIFNARKEHHFTLGAPIPLNADEVSLIGALYEILDTDPTIRNLMSFDFLKSHQGEPFTPERYEAVIVPALIDALMKRKLGIEKFEAKEFFDKLTPEENILVKTYISNSNDPKAIAFVSNIPSREIKNLLALSKEEIHILLKLTTGKLSDVHYGYHPNGAKTAIPYHGSNTPAVKSQFGNPYETWNYTLQLAIKNGISLAILKKEILLLQSLAMQELKEFPNKTLAETAAGKRYHELTSNDSRFSLFGPESQHALLLSKINVDPKKIIYLAKKHIAPEIVNYPYTLNANPQIFNFLFKTVLGFTGTQWNADTYPQGLQTQDDPKITGFTLGILWQNSRDGIFRIPKVNTATFAESLIGTHPELLKAHALIDTAGMARGMENEKIARQLLALPAFKNRKPPIRGVVFYDKNDNKVILEKGEKEGEDKIIPFEHSSLKKEERFTFFDQKHTTGSNILQTATAVAVMTVGKYTILRDLLQSVWRMRGMDKSQLIKFVVDDEVKEVIHTTLEGFLGKKCEDPLTLEHILLYVTYNQALLQGDNNYRSLKHKMYALLQAEFINATISGVISGADLQIQLKKVRNLFITENTNDPWDLFGTPEEFKNSQSVVANDVSKLKNGAAFQAMQAHPAFTASMSSVTDQIETLKTTSVGILAASLLQASADYGKETETEKEAEKERQIEKEKEKELEIQSEGIQGSWHVHEFFGYDTGFGIAKPYMKKQMLNFNIYKHRNHGGYDSENYEIIPRAHFKRLPIAGFDAEILGTSNLINQEVLDHHFNQNLKPVDEVLVVQNVISGELRLILLDQGDAKEFRNFLLEDNYEHKQYDPSLPWNDIARIGLYNFQLGLYRQGKDRFDSAALLQNPKFLRLISQTKFFNGEIFYTDAELPQLKKWIEEQGVEKMFTLFRQEILKWKVDSLKHFSYSTIGRMFTDLGILKEQLA